MLPHPDFAHARQAYSVQVTPTLGGGAYLAGDVLGGLLTFNFKAQASSIMLLSAQLVDDDESGHIFTLQLFRALPTAIANNAPFTLNAADAAKRFAALTFNTWEDLGGVGAQLLTLERAVRLAAIGNLYGFLTVNTGYTPTAGALVISLDAIDLF